MIAATILLNTDVTTRTLKPKCNINYWKYHNHVEVSEITLCTSSPLQNKTGDLFRLQPPLPHMLWSTEKYQYLTTPKLNFCLQFCSPFFHWLSSKCPHKPALNNKLHLVANYITAWTMF
jgi:hypothetical protein